jgi:hypothetical membrane protein
MKELYKKPGDFMTIKKCILALLLIAHVTPSIHANYAIPRNTGLIIASLILCGGGIYQFCKRAHKEVYIITDIVSGAALLAAGIAGIILSDQLVKECDTSFNKGK